MEHKLRIVDTVPVDMTKTLSCGHEVELLSNAYCCFNDDSYEHPCTAHDGLQMQQIELSAVDYYQQPLSQQYKFSPILITELLLVGCIKENCGGQCNFCKAYELIVKEWQAGAAEFMRKRSIECPECHALKLAA